MNDVADRFGFRRIEVATSNPCAMLARAPNALRPLGPDMVFERMEDIAARLAVAP